MLLIGKPSINGPFSMAMLNNHRVSYIITEHILQLESSIGRSMMDSSFQVGGIVTGEDILFRPFHILQ